MKILWIVLLFGAHSACASGDVKCFLEKLTACAKQFGVQGSGQVPVPQMCKVKDQLFACFREVKKECSVDYDLGPTIEMYEKVCTNGTHLYDLLLKYGDCIQNVFITKTVCSQDVIDFLKKFKVITFDVLFEAQKIACRERTEIMNCYFGFVETGCGKEARDFIETMNGASEKVNKEICRDILKDHQAASDE